MTEPAEWMTHIAGLDLTVGTLQRQRCAWCGAVLEERDLALVMVQAKEDGSPGDPPGFWRPGSLVAVLRVDGGGGAMWTIEHVDGEKLPPECCVNIPDEITV